MFHPSSALIISWRLPWVQHRETCFAITSRGEIPKGRGRAVVYLRSTPLGSLPRLHLPIAGISLFCEGASGRGCPELCHCGMAVWHDICCETTFAGNASQASVPLRHQKQVALDCRWHLWRFMAELPGSRSSCAVQRLAAAGACQIR